MPLELVKSISPLLTKKACAVEDCCGVLGAGREKKNHAPTLALSNRSSARIVKAIEKRRLGNRGFLGEIAPKTPDVRGGVIGSCGSLVIAFLEASGSDETFCWSGIPLW